MEYNRRRQLGRASNWRLCDGDSTDRLSYLPDFILYHILSFVETKTVVQTSVLSRRWRCVWKHVPALNFSICSHGTFVDKVLSLRYPTKVHKISYLNTIYTDDTEEDEQENEAEEEEDDDPLVVKLVNYAVSQETRHLELCIGYEELHYGYKFPQSYGSISNCNLNTLHLTGFVIDDRFESFGFQLLTKLEFIGCIYESDQELLDPFAKFPCLKNLRIESDGNIFRGKLKRLRISGLQLHSLELERMDLAGVEICAPMLKSFKLCHCWAFGPLLELAFPSLDCADIEINSSWRAEPEHMVLMLKAFHNVTSLIVGKRTIKVLCEDFEFLEQQPSPFTRLENLKLDLWLKNDYKIPYRLVSYFLRGSSCASPIIKAF